MIGKGTESPEISDSSSADMPHKIKSVSLCSRPKNAISCSRNSKHPVVVPDARYKKRRSADEGSLRRSAAETLKAMMSVRSSSQQERRRKSADLLQRTSRKETTTQFSLFQSPFNHEDEDTYRYDFNISYHKNQTRWVEEFLVPILETELGFRCYLNERDSLPGISTVKNISAAVKESRITVLCFSKDYLSSSWQNFEALLAHHMDPGGWKKRIIPIIVEDCSLPFKYTIYATLKWPEYSSGMGPESVPATVRLRRRFFIFGLLNAVGVQSKERALEIYKKYYNLSVPVVLAPREAAEEKRSPVEGWQANCLQTGTETEIL